MRITGSYSNDAMLRTISEGVRIDKVPEGSLINLRNEWNYSSVPRAIVAYNGAFSFLTTESTQTILFSPSYSNTFLTSAFKVVQKVLHKDPQK